MRYLHKFNEAIQDSPINNIEEFLKKNFLVVINPFNNSFLVSYDSKSAYLTKGLSESEFIIRQNGEIDLFESDQRPHRNAPKEFRVMINNQSFKHSYTKLPVKLNKVYGIFQCDNSGLETLEGCPDSVYSFTCTQNKIENLIGGPKTIKMPSRTDLINGLIGRYNCSFNSKLTSLEGAPTEVYHFICHGTRIKNLKGSPKYCTEMNLFSNGLTSLEGGPEFIKWIDLNSNLYLYETGGWRPKSNDTNMLDGLSVEGVQILCDNDILTKDKDYNTPILNIAKHFFTADAFFESVEIWNYIKHNQINKKLFQEVCAEYSIEMPEVIERYTYV